MDKFGIFKLLNSFFNFCEQNKSDSSSNRGGNSGLSTLLSAFSPQHPPTQNDSSSSTPITTKEQSQQTQNKALPPLQNSMLGIMNTHDEFVKRVKQKNSTK